MTNRKTTLPRGGPVHLTPRIPGASRESYASMTAQMRQDIVGMKRAFNAHLTNHRGINAEGVAVEAERRCIYCRREGLINWLGMRKRFAPGEQPEPKRLYWVPGMDPGIYAADPYPSIPREDNVGNDIIED